MDTHNHILKTQNAQKMETVKLEQNIAEFLYWFAINLGYVIVPGIAENNNYP